MKFNGEYYGFIPVNENFIQVVFVKIEKFRVFIKTTDNEYLGKINTETAIEFNLRNSKNDFPFTLILSVIKDISIKGFNGTWSKISSQNLKPTLGKIIIVEKQESNFEVDIYPIDVFKDFIYETEYYIVPFEELFRETTFQKAGVININSHYRKKYTIDVLEELRIPISQYLLFFKEYVVLTKGENIEVNIIQGKFGINIHFSLRRKLAFSLIQSWLEEYISFTQNTLNELKVNFYTDLAKKEKELVIENLKNQISTFQESLRLAQQKAKLLKKENKFLKGIISTTQNYNRLTRSKKNPLKVDLLYLVSNDKIKQCFERLEDLFIENNNEEYNQITLLRSKFNRIRKDKNKGTISNNRYDKEMNKIINIIIEIIQHIED